MDAPERKVRASNGFSANHKEFERTIMDFAARVGEACHNHEPQVAACECKREEMILLSIMLDALHRDSSPDNPSPGLIVETEEPSTMSKAQVLTKEANE